MDLSTRFRTRRELAIEARLGMPLPEWIDAGRKDGRSWRTLARQVRFLTGQPVTAQTLHNWFGETEQP